MTLYNSAYPQRVRPWLKSMPSMALLVGFFSLIPVILNLRDYRLYERTPKTWDKSNFFEGMMRRRQDRFMYIEYPTLFSQPAHSLPRN